MVYSHTIFLLQSISLDSNDSLKGPIVIKTEQLFVDMQNLYLEQLLDLVIPEQRINAASIAAKYRLACMGPQSTTDNRELVYYHRAINAIEGYLSKIGHPATADEIIDGVVSQRGFNGGGAGMTRGKVRKSLNAHTERLHTRIKKCGDLIGLIEWEDSLFQ